MIVVQLIGGLGNQLFQYAAGRALAEHHRTKLVLDVTGFAAYRLRSYCLQHFQTQQNFASTRQLASFDPTRRRWFRKPGVIFEEKHGLHFDPDLLNVGSQVYLKGHWQNERYFQPIESIIRREFTVATPPDPDNASIADQIRHSHSVSVHVRRGDYVNNPVHGVCSLDYYAAAVRHIHAKVVTPHFFVFSDDAAWARDHLRFDQPVTFVSHNSKDAAHEDLRLMSLCQHHIIANSTFSWWGAWLGCRPGKLVCAPEQWFMPDQYDSSDLLPADWVKL